MRFHKQAVVNGITIHYALVGSDGPTFILIHGLGSEPGLLRGPFAHFGSSWRVLVPVLRGHSPSGLDLPYTNEQLASDVLMLADSLTIERFVAVGFSRGAQVAFTLAAQWPDRVQAVISLGGVARASKAELDGASALYELLRGPDGLDRFAEHFSGRLVSKSTQTLNPALRSYGKMNVLRHTPATTIELIKSNYASDIRPILPSVRCPTLLLVGAEDQIAGLPPQVELKAGLADCRVRVLPNVGHDYAGEAPSAINALMSEFVIGVLAREISEASKRL